MRFRFNEKKAAQAAAFLLSRHQGRMNYTVLLKLLYLADRKALIERGLPITGDAMVSMPNGTALTTVCDLLRDEVTGHERIWFKFVSPPQGYDVSAAGNQDIDELSQYELDVLEIVDRERGHLNWLQIVDYTHALPEWDNPGRSSKPILPERILQLAGISEEEISRLGEEAEAFNAFDSMAGR